MRLRTLRCGALAVVALAVLAGPVGACGGLVGENGTIKLARTSTLAAYGDGVERYVTSFEFTGEGEEVGSIIPLPGVPTTVERGGDWTLQRLEQEVAPKFSTGDVLESRAASPDAEVVLETTVDALDITILRGGGDAVGRWAIDHGFLLTPDAPEVLDFYSRRSKVFMAARFDASRAKELGQERGDGTPIMLTIPTKEPWVPLRILGLGLEKSEVVQADVFLLTPERPQLLAGSSGLSLDRSEPATAGLLADLRSDKGMAWVPSKMWFSYLSLNAPAGDLDDLAISAHAGVAPSATAAGLGSSAVIGELDGGAPVLPVAIAGGVAIAAGFGGAAVRHRRARRQLTSRGAV
jgi:Uncharacterized protein conserved in bacteria (DUF2330)